MLNNLKALIIVLPVAMLVFAAAKSTCLQFMTEEDFRRRRNIWLGLTLTAFISPSFWLFVFLAFVLIAWGARRDANPVALYVLLLHTIPPVLAMEIPIVGVNALFTVDFPRVLAFAILIPAARQLMRSNDKSGNRKLTAMDGLLLGYGALVVVLQVPHESITASVRRAFLFALDFLLLYFVVSRYCTSRRVVVEAMASFGLACAILAPLALVEALLGWMLYAGVGVQWDAPLVLFYDTRAGLLRGQASAGHSIALGNLLAIGFGFWLYLRSRVAPGLSHIAVPVLLWVGLLAASSRGPWLAAVALLVAHLALAPKGAGRVFRASLIFAAIAGVIVVSPLGERVIDRLPFVGTVGAENVTYREQLLVESWEQIKEHPFFGNPLVLTQLESMRQGQGIIDLLNTYATIAMFYGGVALSLYLGFILCGIWKAFRLNRACAGRDPDASLLGGNLVACLLALLLMQAVGGFGPGVEKLLYLIVGFAAGLAAGTRFPVTAAES